MVTSPLPSGFASRVVNGHQNKYSGSINSRVSSMLMMRCAGGINGMQTLSNDVFPEPVPPDTRMFDSYCVANHIKAKIDALPVLFLMKSVTVHGSRANFLMVSVCPLLEMGYSTAFALSPVSRCASSSGVRLVICRPTRRPIVLK